MCLHRLLCLACVVYVYLAIPVSVRAQETRADVIAAQQAQKAKDLNPYTPGRVEVVFEELRRRFVEQPNGIYPYFGSVYGGGFMLGAGYRRLVGEASQWYVHGLYSIRQYKLLEVGTASRGHAGGRLSFTTRVGFRDATQLPFYGLGMQTPLSDRANTRLVQTYAEGAARVTPIRFVVLTGSVAVEDFRQREPLGTRPSVSAVFSPLTTPGLDAEPTYLHSGGSAAIDWRTSPGYSRRGGYYGAAVHNYADRDDTYSFSRLDVDLIQHLPIWRETWALSLRGRIQSTLGDSDVVPFFLLPSLGSGDTLRAYNSWRFRDRHSLLTTAEWRWFPNKNGFDMALFYDAGKVASRRGDLDFEGLTSNVGIGARFHGPAVTALRMELARGSEGWNAIFAADAAF
jgi:hypothetical protein